MESPFDGTVGPGRAASSARFIHIISHEKHAATSCESRSTYDSTLFIDVESGRLAFQFTANAIAARATDKHADSQMLLKFRQVSIKTDSKNHKFGKNGRVSREITNVFEKMLLNC